MDGLTPEDPRPTGDPEGRGGPVEALPPGNPHPDGGPGGLPWEDRKNLGFSDAFLGTAKLLVLRPEEAFRRMRPRGDFASPVLWAVILGWVGGLIQDAWARVLGPPDLSMLPPQLAEQLEPFFDLTTGGVLLHLLVAPLWTLAALFAWSGIVHVFLMLLGGDRDSPAGFEGTLRVIAYASLVKLARLLPVMGGLIGLIWASLLGIIGLAVVHHTTRGKALAALALPGILFCLCGGIAMLVLAAGVLRGMGGGLGDLLGGG